jgi:hypothetical protein
MEHRRDRGHRPDHYIHQNHRLPKPFEIRHHFTATFEFCVDLVIMVSGLRVGLISYICGLKWTTIPG